MSEDTNKQGTAALRECIRCYRKGEWSKQVPEWTVTQEQAERELAALVAAPALAVRDTLEMAAKVCDDWAKAVMESFPEQALAVEQRATQIRALAPAEVIRAGEAHDARLELQVELIRASLRWALSEIGDFYGRKNGVPLCRFCSGKGTAGGFENEVNHEDTCSLKVALDDVAGEPKLEAHDAAIRDGAEARVVEVLRGILDGFEKGIWVRSTEGDGDAAWAIKLARYLRPIALGQQIIVEHDARSASVKPNLSTRERRQKVVMEWCVKAFGEDQSRSVPQRVIRLLEESVEAYQAAGCDEEMAHKLVSYVFSRPVGQLGQELGGVGLVLLSVAEAAGLDADGLEQEEVLRVLSKPLEHFTKRNQSKNDAGFAAASVKPVAPTDDRPNFGTVPYSKKSVAQEPEGK